MTDAEKLKMVKAMTGETDLPFYRRKQGVPQGIPLRPHRDRCS